MRRLEYLMKKTISFFLLFGITFVILNCDKKVNSGGRKPFPLTMLYPTPDTLQVERGIDAIPEGNVIQVAWIPKDDSDIRHYLLYRTRDIDNPFIRYAQIAPSDSIYLDENVFINNRYYYFMYVVNNDGLQSDPSDTVDYMLVEKAIELHVTLENDRSRPDFTWTDPNPHLTPYYTIRVLKDATEEYVWISKVETQFNEIPKQTIRFNETGNAFVDSLETNVIYKWRVDIQGVEDASGSESEWETILLN